MQKGMNNLVLSQSNCKIKCLEIFAPWNPKPFYAPTPKTSQEFCKENLHFGNWETWSINLEVKLQFANDLMGVSLKLRVIIDCLKVKYVWPKKVGGKKKGCNLTAYAIAYPSKVLVPRPSSSRMTRESSVAFWSTEAVSVHSTKKVPTKITGLPSVLKQVYTIMYRWEIAGSFSQTCDFLTHTVRINF